MQDDRRTALAPDLAGRVEEHARRCGLSREEAYADLLERGLAGFDRDAVADGSGEHGGDRSPGDRSGDPTADGADDRVVAAERSGDRTADEGHRDDGEGWAVPETFADVAPTRSGRLRWFGTLLVVLGVVVAAGYALLLVVGLSYFGADPTGGIAVAIVTAAVGLLLLILGWIGGWLGPYATLVGRRLRIALDPDEG